MASETLTTETRVRVYDGDGNIVSERTTTQQVNVDTVETIEYGEAGYGDGPYGGSE